MTLNKCNEGKNCIALVHEEENLTNVKIVTYESWKNEERRRCFEFSNCNEKFELKVYLNSVIVP